MVRRMSAQQARDNFGEMVDSVSHSRETVVVEKRGKPVVAVIPNDEYEQFRDWRVMEALKHTEPGTVDTPHLDEDELYEVVQTEIDAYRAEKRAERNAAKLSAD